ncbi:MAG: hypothetical protein AAF651_14020 [Cyanobacteria bacterium P01_C01_bin.73]
MPKKRLSDLLREEIDPNHSAQPSTDEATQLPDRAADQSAEQAKPENAAGTAERAPKSESKSDAPTPARRTRSRTSAKSTAKASPAAKTSSNRGPTKAALETQLAEIDAQLKATSEREQTLIKQVDGLKADMERQQSLIFELKEKLDTAQHDVTAKAEAFSQLTQELETAKQTILKLNEQSQAKAPPQRLARSSLPKTQPQAQQLPKQPLNIRRPTSHPNAKRIAPLPKYVVQSEPKSSMLTDEEIGWVD